MKILLLLSVQLIVISRIHCAGTFDVTKYGADNTGKSKITDAVKKAIDAAEAAGGGDVHFPAGSYLSTSIVLKSNVVLDFASGVTVTFSSDKSDYKSGDNLISASGAKNIGVKGKATLDGQGAKWWDKSASTNTNPIMMYFNDCTGVTLSDFTIKNSPHFNINPHQSNDVTIKGVTIDNPYDSHNTDGINANGINGLHIDSVTISTGDDCVVLDANTGHPTKNVVISNSHMKEGHSGVGMGSVLNGGISNVTVSNCNFDGTDRGLYIKSMRGRGGVVENVKYSGITMNVKKEGICLNMIYDASNQDAALHNTSNIPKNTFDSTTPVYKDLTFDGVKGSSTKNPIYFVGLPQSLIENIKMTSVDITSKDPTFLINTKDVTLNGKSLPNG